MSDQAQAYGEAQTARAELMTDILDALTFEGDEYEMDDNRTLRFKVEQDDCMVTDLWSDECYGKIAPVESNRHDIHPMPRPDGFDGRARKIQYTRGNDQMWWQPPTDLTDEQIPEQYKLVRDLLELGFYTFGVQLLDADDDEIDVEWMGGIEPSAIGHDADAVTYRRDILGSLVDEILDRLDAERQAMADEDAEHQHPWMVTS